MKYNLLSNDSDKLSFVVSFIYTGLIIVLQKADFLLIIGLIARHKIINQRAYCAQRNQHIHYLLSKYQNMLNKYRAI